MLELSCVCLAIGGRIAALIHVTRNSDAQLVSLTKQLTTNSSVHRQLTDELVVSHDVTTSQNFQQKFVVPTSMNILIPITII
jgi:hypothetical protein